MVAEIDISFAIARNTFGKVEIGSQLIYLVHIVAEGLLMGLLAGHYQTGKFPGTDVDIFVYIEYGDIVGIFNLRLVVQVQEGYIFTITNAH